MVRCKCAIYMKIDFVLNRSQFEESIVENDLHKQVWGTNRPTDQPKSRTIARQTWQATARIIKNGYGKEPIITNNLHGQAKTENNRATGWTIDREQSNNQRPSELTTEADSSVRPNAIGRLTEQSIEQSKTTVRQSREWWQTIDQMNTRTITITSNMKRGPELVKVLDQGLKVCNRPRAYSQLQSVMFRRLRWKDK